MRKLFALFLLTILLFGTVLPVEACENNPPTNTGTIECNDLGYGYQLGFRINGAKNGNYRFTPAFGRLTGGAPSDPAHSVTISGSDSKSFDWDSNIGVDAVIVSTSYKPKVYKSTDLTSGSGYAGQRDSRGRKYPITKVEFCYNYNLSISQTAKGETARSVSWEITKTMSPASQVKFVSEAATFDYTVSVVKTVSGSSTEGISVTGELTITNETPLPAYITSGKVRLNPGSISVRLDCGKLNRYASYKLYPGKSITCTYTKPLDTRLDGEATAWVMTRGAVVGGTSTVPIEWSERGESGGSETITVTDSQEAFGGPYTVSESTTWTYSIDIPCPTDPSAYTDGYWNGEMVNTAAIAETGQSASQTAALECYAPSLSQTTSTSVSRQYLWGIDKTGSTSELALDLYNSEFVDYTVLLSITGTLDNGQMLTGTATVSNPHPTADLTASLAGDAAGAPLTWLDCANPVTVPAAGSITCAFEVIPADSKPGSSTVTLSFNGLNFTSAMPYDFSSGAVTETDRCVTVTDDKAGELGTTCADQAPAAFNYTLTIGGYTRCGEYTYSNTASFVTNDTQAAGMDTWDVISTIPCITNCVTVVSYWPAHADPTADPLGNSFYDNAWDLVQPSGPSSPLFETNDTWLSAFSFNPRLSAYYAMAQEYMAAQLNVYRGADPSALADSLGRAAELLAEYDTHPGDVTGTVLAEFNSLKTLFNKYNRGLSGPEPCCY